MTGAHTASPAGIDILVPNGKAAQALRPKPSGRPPSRFRLSPPPADPSTEEPSPPPLATALPSTPVTPSPLVRTPSQETAFLARQPPSLVTCSTLSSSNNALETPAWEFDQDQDVGIMAATIPLPFDDFMASETPPSCTDHTTPSFPGISKVSAFSTGCTISELGSSVSAYPMHVIKMRKITEYFDQLVSVDWVPQC